MMWWYLPPHAVDFLLYMRTSGLGSHIWLLGLKFHNVRLSRNISQPVLNTFAVLVFLS